MKESQGINSVPSGVTALGEQRILVVDDEEHVRRSLSLFLKKKGYPVDEAKDGVDAKVRIEEGKYFLVITDIAMPGVDGLELLHYVKTTTPTTDVVIMTGNPGEERYTAKALEDGAFWYFNKPFKYDFILIILDRILERQHLKNKELEYERLCVEYKATLESTLLLAQAVDAKDRYTKDHSKRVSEFSVQLAQELGLDEERIRIVEYAGLLHDIGKIGIPEQILNKEGKLTDVEFFTMKKHPETGETILSQSTLLRPLSRIIRSHHENYDGSGYPDGLKGEAIPVESRILRIADYFDAITSIRPYRQPLELEEALNTMRQGAGKFFDPNLVDTFIKTIEERELAPKPA